MSILAADALQYPFPEMPAAGETVEVADGIFWLSIPIPFTGLKQVNVWLLRDSGGWMMIDTGYGKSELRDMLRTTWERVLGGRPITRLLLTHFHPDHSGNSGWVAEKWNLRPLMSQAEWLAGNLAVRHGLTDDMSERAAFYERHGLDAAGVGAFREGVVPYADGVWLPSSHRRLRGGEGLQIGEDHWEVLIGEGHSPEHVSLLCRKRRILIAGDQILPTITTNVSVWPGEPEGDPLGLFLETCRRFDKVVPEDVLVLPSHRSPFRNVRHRLRKLATHHAERLNLVLQAAHEPITAAELIGPMFRRDLDGHQIGFAMGEALAHLNHLVEIGRMERLDASRTVRFRRRPGAMPVQSCL